LAAANSTSWWLADERFRLVVEAIPIALIAADRAGRIDFVNTATEKLFRYRAGELVGQSVEILVPERFRGKHPQHREDFGTTPDPREMGSGCDLYGLRKDGAEIPVEISLIPVQTDQGLIIVSAIIDISERRCAENELIHTYSLLESRVEERTAELNQANQQLNVLNENLDAFVYVAAHDLQEPVRNLVSFATLLRRDLGSELPERAARDLSHITDAAKRMQRLVGDLLRLSQSGKFQHQTAARLANRLRRDRARDP